MSRERKGSIVERAGKLYVRVCYTDQLGKRRELMRRATDRKHARELKMQLIKQLDSAEGNERAELDGAKLTFRQLAERYESVRLIPAQYVGDPPRKVAGLHSFETPKLQLRFLVEHFGNARVRNITHSQVDEYRLKRLGAGLKISSANRELALLRSVFNFAKRERFITRTPFEMGAPLISAADETKRDRVLSSDEEEKLLLALSDGRRVHIRVLVVPALDTGARKNELLNLTWRDIDPVSGVITIQAFNSKTAKSRQVPISDRLKGELQRIRAIGARRIPCRRPTVQRRVVGRLWKKSWAGKEGGKDYPLKLPPSVEATFTMGPTMSKCNYRAELLVLNVGRFPGLCMLGNVPKCPKVLGQSRNVPRKHGVGACGSILRTKTAGLSAPAVENTKMVAL